MNLKRTFLYGILSCAILLSCKKDAPDPEEEIISPTTGTRLEFTLDSIFLYARQVYLWSDALPSYASFNPRQYALTTPELTAVNKELFDISQLKKNPATGNPYELPLTAGRARYSFLQKGTASGTLASTAAAAESPVWKTNLIKLSADQVAYIALGSFPLLSSCKTALDEAFAAFAPANPKYLVVDLRGNGGGYVETAEYTANLIATTALNGKIMYTEKYNSLMQSGKASILKHQPYLDTDGKPVQYNGRNATMADVDYTERGNTYRFSKKGTLNSLTTIYFIVSASTASASELLISAMKPYFNVKLAGSKTYGKPVGFFAIHIDTYSVYLSGFLIRNATGWSDYFEGMSVDIPVTYTGTPLLGDPEEPCLKAVLASINVPLNLAVLQNKPSAISSNTAAQSSSVTRSNSIAETTASDTPPALMIENRLRLKAQ